MSTLRYADQAKSIVNSVRINEDPFARTVRRLNLEVTDREAGASECGPTVVGKTYLCGTRVDNLHGCLLYRAYLSAGCGCSE